MTEPTDHRLMNAASKYEAMSFPQKVRLANRLRRRSGIVGLHPVLRSALAEYRQIKMSNRRASD